MCRMGRKGEADAAGPNERAATQNEIAAKKNTSPSLQGWLVDRGGRTCQAKGPMRRVK